MAEMIVIASPNGAVGMDAAVETLRRGGSALDAVEAACRIVEDDPSDHSVGTGGYPNALGVVELDASVMEGTERRAGAVAALQGFPHPVSVARAVLERLPQHALLCGEGAAQFARAQGFAAGELLTEDAAAAWRRYRDDAASGDTRLPTHEEIAERMRRSPPINPAGTVNFLARDREGHLASAVSTSGWPFKYPGRVGDSPLIGAGNYCDDRYGACACVGVGEWSIRVGVARQLVLRLELGQSLADAGRAVMADLSDVTLPAGIAHVMNFVALDARTGEHAGFSTESTQTYVYQTPDMPSCRHVPVIFARDR